MLPERFSAAAGRGKNKEIGTGGRLFREGKNVSTHFIPVVLVALVQFALLAKIESAQRAGFHADGG